MSYIVSNNCVKILVFNKLTNVWLCVKINAVILLLLEGFQ